MKRSSLRALILAACATAATANAQAPTTPPPVNSQQVAGHVYVLTGGGGANSSLLIGPQGALLVDTKGPGATERIVAIAKELGSAPIRFVVNGHVHPDHTDGNANFAKRGAVIIAHQEVRDVLAAGQRGGPPSPAEALPVLTFGDGGEIDLYLNDEHVRVFHAPPAHSHDNSIVQYVESNVLHLGDLYGPNRYQLIAGGTFQGFIDGADLALKLADENTKIIPGVGAVGDRAALVAYRHMLVTVRDRIAQRVAAGDTLEQVIASKPTAEFDAVWGSPDHALFLPVIYAELAGKR